MRAHVLALAGVTASLLFAQRANAQDMGTFVPIPPVLPATSEERIVVRDGDRVMLSLGPLELERVRNVHYPFDAMKVRQERFYLSHDRGDGSPRLSLSRDRERQDFPGGLKLETFILSLNWRF